ncbi:hypothetical protein BC937DRAFT_91644 [Endogone sp. FLAS-F59071]|nr:hypothetical protein BC937DRAFT_91644 [Endogone sp. FLAS-F59071]|eukprot:RUS16061.1 hypothetical protein BC937DRAFT_91644 [Endogone sp. FLAS-F59071]
MTSQRRSRGGNHGGKGTSARQQALAAQQAQLSSEEESSDADSVTRCVCGQQHHVGLMVQCDKCEVWQHCDCVGLSEEDIPDQYYCELCKPENHTTVKGHGRNKRVYKPNGAKDTASKKSPKKRTTMNSREASVPLSDAILHRTTKSNSFDENPDYTTGRSSKRRRRTDGADRDDDDNEPHTNGRGGSHDSHDAKSQRSTSPASSRNSNASRKKETSKSSNDSAGSNNGVKRSRSGSPAVTVQEPRSYESDNEASSGSGGGAGPHASSSSSGAGKKRRRNDDKTTPSRQGSSSANDDDAKIDPNDERESLADALFVKTELSDVETPLGADDEEIEPVKSGSTASEHKKEPHSSSPTKTNGAGSRSSLIKRSSSGSRRNPPPHSSGTAKSRDNNLSAHRDSHVPSSHQQHSRTSTPQPESNGSSSHSSSHDKDRSRCPSPPAKVRYPSTRMSLSEMNKRAKQILEYISRLQVEMADKKDEPAGDADVDEDESPPESGKRRHTPVIVVGTDKDMVVEVLHSQDGEVADGKADLPHELITTAANILVTATAASTPGPNVDGTTGMDIDMDELNVEMLQPESASSSATTIPLERPRSMSPSPIVATAQPPATTITATTSDPHMVHPQPSLSSSSTSSTISSATTTLTSDAEIALASTSAPIVNHSAGDLSSVEMMDKLARELIKFQRKFGGHHHDAHTANGVASSSASSSVQAANGSSSTSTLSAAQIQHHHNTRERERSERERERSAERDRDVVESLLLMSTDLAALGALPMTDHHLHPMQHHHHMAAREGSAGSAFARRNEGAGGRRVASVTVR